MGGRGQRKGQNIKGQNITTRYFSFFHSFHLINRHFLHSCLNYRQQAEGEGNNGKMLQGTFIFTHFISCANEMFYLDTTCIISYVILKAVFFKYLQ
jgi:hypothetical protein